MYKRGWLLFLGLAMKAVFLGSIGVIAETSELQRQAFNAAFKNMALIGIGVLQITVKCSKTRAVLNVLPPSLIAAWL
jgi:hypothetical protein